METVCFKRFFFFLPISANRMWNIPLASPTNLPFDHLSAGLQYPNRCSWNVCGDYVLCLRLNYFLLMCLPNFYKFSQCCVAFEKQMLFKCLTSERRYSRRNDVFPSEFVSLRVNSTSRHSQVWEPKVFTSQIPSVGNACFKSYLTSKLVKFGCKAW